MPINLSTHTRGMSLQYECKTTSLTNRKEDCLCFRQSRITADATRI